MRMKPHITGGVAVVSEIEPEEVGRALTESDRFQSFLPKQVYRAIASWAEAPQGFGTRRNRSLFQRDKFVTPGKVFEQMAMAYDALDDDIVGNVVDTSEAMAFQKITFECDDKDQEDVWNQIARDLDLDTWVRQAWRELFTVSQFYGVRWWGNKTYKVRGKRDKRTSRKEFDLLVPIGLGLLDPTRVVPVENDHFRSTTSWPGLLPKANWSCGTMMHEGASSRTTWSGNCSWGSTTLHPPR